jgi:phosphoribosyl 1,2-cyclic phosphodiesterase
VRVTFWGVRGSTPCSCDANRRYGGNTACVSIEAAGHDPIVCDLGTGLREWGRVLPAGQPFRGTALVSHLHWDHVQGLPFFGPLLRPGARLDVYGPSQQGASLAEAFERFLAPPFFPVSIADLPGEIRFHDVSEAEVAVGDAKVTVRPVPHVGATNGYRIEWGHVSVAYVSDHQSPETAAGEGRTVDDAVLELCQGADLLIHDAQYWPTEWDDKRTWGHCTVDYAVQVAKAAGVRRLALFHHDPAHADGEVDDLLGQARRLAAGSIEEVLAASEGLTISFD